jgi:hypothetical protein
MAWREKETGELPAARLRNEAINTDAAWRGMRRPMA